MRRYILFLAGAAGFVLKGPDRKSRITMSRRGEAKT
jgi:hypothetical protein